MMNELTCPNCGTQIKDPRKKEIETITSELVAIKKFIEGNGSRSWKEIISDWKPTNSRFVAFLDLLGFKDMVAKNTHEGILEKFRSLSAFAQVHKRDFQAHNVFATIFSDSIIIFSKDDSNEAAGDFIFFVRHLICRAIELRLGIKGGLAFGELTVDPLNQLYFGQPLIDAYQLEEELQCYGAVLHSTAEERLASIPEKVVSKYNFTRIPTKLKKHGTIDMLNLNWYGLAITVKESHGFDIDKYLDDIQLSVSDKPRPMEYLQNTMETIAEMVKPYKEAEKRQQIPM